MTSHRFAKTTAPRKRDGATVRVAKTRICEVVVVCAKCAKRQGLRPRDVRDLLKGAAKRAARDGRLPDRAKIRVVESGCLGPCPKRALAVATGASVATGRVLLLDPAAGPEAALAAVLGAGRPPEFGPNADLEPRPIASTGPALAPSGTPSGRASATGHPDASPSPA